MEVATDMSITGSALKQVILKYIPNQFIKNIDFSELESDSSEKKLSDGWIPFLQKIIDNGSDDMIDYGTAQNLAKELFNSLMFLSNHRIFEFDITEKYFKHMQIYRTYYQSPFIYKQDLFINIQQHLFYIIPEKFIRSLIMVLLKTSERKLDGCCELVKFDQNFVKNGLTIDELTQNDKTLEKRLKDVLSDWSSEEMEIINSVSQKFKNQCENEEEYEKVIQKSCHVLKTVKKFSDSNPEMFLPNSVTPNNKNPLILRYYFTNSGCQFVFYSELHNIMYLNQKKKNPDQKPFGHEDDDGYMRAIHFNHVWKFRPFLFEVQQIGVKLEEFAYTPLPIMSHTGEYYVAAGEVCGYMQEYWISNMKLFFKLRKDQWILFEKYLEWFRKEIRMNVRYILYISLKKFNSIMDFTNEYFKEFENVPARMIKKVRKIGFTAMDFKKEVKRVELIDLFPECEPLLDNISNSIIAPKKQKSLGTREMLSLVKTYIGNGIMIRYPELHKFRKDQLKVTCEGECWDGIGEPTITRGESRSYTVPALNDSDKDEETLENVLQEEADDVPDSDSPQENISNSKEEKVVESVEKEPEIDEISKKVKELEEVITELQKKNDEISVEKETLEEANKQLTDEKRHLVDSNYHLIDETNHLNSKLKISEQKTEKVQEQMEKMKNESDKIIRGMEMEKKKENAENRKIVKELTESDAKHLKRVTELESQLEEANQKAQKVEQEAKHQKVESHRKIVALETENKKLLKSLEQQKVDKPVESSQHKTEKECPDKLNQLKKQLNSKNNDIEQLKKQLNSRINEVENFKREVSNKKRALSESREMNDVIKKSMDEELEKKARENSELTRKIADLQSLLTNSEKKAEEMKREWVQKMQPSSRNDFQSSSNQEITDKNRIINKQQTTIDRLSGQVYQQNLTINAFFNRIGKKQEFKCASTQTEEQNGFPDDECGICLLKMRPNEHIFECNHCQKETHLKCSQKWFQQNSTCVHCRGLVRLPSEFPPLS